MRGTFAYFFLFVLLLIGCRNSSKHQENYFKVTGNAQGTTYSIIYSDSLARNFKPQIDSLLQRFDSSLSTYKPNSIISRFNNSDSGVVVDLTFVDMLSKSWTVYQISEGAFDPSINPLLSFWGFNKEKIENIDSIDVQQLNLALSQKGFNQLVVAYDGREILLKDIPYLSYKGDKFLKKPFKGLQLNFNAIAQGYSVDLLAKMLEKFGCKNYMVELGGEMKVKGNNTQKELWRLGVDEPIENASERKLNAIISLNNGALATSGNYRKFYVKNGKKYAHTINPKDGYPVQHNLLSTTIIAEDCWMADGLATACMVKGVEWAKTLTHEVKGLNVYLIYDEEGKFSTFQSNPKAWKLETVN